MTRSVVCGFLACLIATAIAPDAPTYTKEGEMVFPANYREWIYLSSGFGMSYNSQTSSSTFDNVFVNPAAYRSFLDHGVWPDKTVLVLELRDAQSKGSINQGGHYQSSRVKGLEVHVKDDRFPGKWAFFDFDNGGSGKLIPQSAGCYSCHAEHGAVDTTFVQFYPTLLKIAEEKGTMRTASGSVLKLR